jgi:hypothetical protein
MPLSPDVMGHFRPFSQFLRLVDTAVLVSSWGNGVRLGVLGSKSANPATACCEARQNRPNTMDLAPVGKDWSVCQLHQSARSGKKPSPVTGPLCDRPRDGHPLRCIYVVQCLLISKDGPTDERGRRNTTRRNALAFSAPQRKPYWYSILVFL